MMRSCGKIYKGFKGNWLRLPVVSFNEPLGNALNNLNRTHCLSIAEHSMRLKLVYEGGKVPSFQVGIFIFIF